jgi:hypothetical protein
MTHKAEEVAAKAGKSSTAGTEQTMNARPADYDLGAFHYRVNWNLITKVRELLGENASNYQLAGRSNPPRT